MPAIRVGLAGVGALDLRGIALPAMVTHDIV